MEIWRKALIENKDKIKYVTFKLSFYKDWYALKLIDKTGYVMCVPYGNCAIDIHKTELKECLDFIKSNKIAISKYSVFQ